MVVESSAYKALIQIHADRIIHIQGPRDADEYLSEVGENAPVMSFVGVGQIAAGDLRPRNPM